MRDFFSKESFGIDFEKSQKHEDLRGLKLRHLAGKTPEIRRRAV